MLAGDDAADAGFAFGDGGEDDAGGHNPGFEEGAGEVHGETAVADDDGSDGGFAGGSGAASNVEAGVGELLFEVVGVRPEAFYALRFIFQDVEGCDAGGGDGGWVRGGEEEGASVVVEEVDEVAGAADIAAERSDGFGEGADLDVDFVGGVEVIYGAAAVSTEDPGGVGVVDHHDGAVSGGEVG